MGLVAVVLAVVRLLTGNWGTAGVLTSLGFILFFSYGHVYAYLERLNATGLLIGRHRYLLPIWGMLFALGVWRVLRTKDVRRWTPVLNVAAGIALAIPVLGILAHEARSGIEQAAIASASSEECQLVLPQDRPPPDIYYLVLDGYMRDDVLLEVSGFDNSEFLDSLSEMGFVVARASQSNYPRTSMSLSSSLNMDYLGPLGWEGGWDDTERARGLIVHNRLRRELECLGYTTVAFETGFEFTEWKDADYYLTPHATGLSRLQLGAGITDFEHMWIETSGGVVVLDSEKALANWFPQESRERGQEWRERILFALSQVPSIAASSSPKLVFVHIIAPHAPYVFDRNGGHIYIDASERPAPEIQPAIGHPYWKAYADEMVYVNGLLLETVQALLANSAVPPVIVVQGDHGYVSSPQQARMLILNAYFLPGDGNQRIYESISPVNTFRVVLDEYFGGDYGLLPDMSYVPSEDQSRFDELPGKWDGLP
jgi:hypothetical protein